MEISKPKALDEKAMKEARERHDTLTKPPGSLGLLEEIGIQLAGIYAVCPPPVPEPACVVIFAGDHGVVDEGVTPWPQEITEQMVSNFVNGGAAVNVLSQGAGAEVVVVDVGVLGDLDEVTGVVHKNVRHGTGNIKLEPAMSADELELAIQAGVEVAKEQIANGVKCFLTGDMGIGNTTPSAGLIAHFSRFSVEQVTGRGTGIDDAMLRHKVEVITEALARLAPTSLPKEVLAEIGGLEIAALVGFMIEGAANQVPVIIDGVIACAAALCAVNIEPGVLPYLIAGHRSKEPGAAIALRILKKTPLLDLDLRLGEGTGACLALPIVQAAAKVLQDMATFTAAGVSEKA